MKGVMGIVVRLGWGEGAEKVERVGKERSGHWGVEVSSGWWVANEHVRETIAYRRGMGEEEQEGRMRGFGLFVRVRHGCLE